ncbi:energy-coupling factor transporter transmembrane component T family protein [Calidifontibacillus erzurumensis]|uniref:Energy-coupling factor transporter transmembrane protein EcfT n=1 Tax=Calidifontibacillus erzurumensis TaxID=2741433 RepID=A0A8J8GES1_9BACI|nr:energy-coupling factor transporter transmembrane component T [Calidifontibacillus erzurumensis]NSL52560.1 energy-coupling factor transporter transmembrane protein EcfT [Calidifontibacillus erzurumensis]
MKNVIIGQYVPGDSFIYRMDPRAKILAIFLFVFIIFLANNIATYSILLLFTVGAVLSSKVPVRYVFNGLKPILWIVLFTLVLHLFMTKEGDIVVDFGWLTIYEEGIKQGVFISIRFVLLIVITSLLTLTTTPIEITDGMEALLSPFKKIGVPAHEIALMMSISLRFIPTLMEETEKIMKAQSARGVDFSSGTLKERFQAIIPLLVPLFISAFKRAEDLALAMEARGYRGGEGRTRLRKLVWKAQDHVAFLILAVMTVFLIILRS